MTSTTYYARAFQNSALGQRLATLRSDLAQRRVYRTTLAELEGLSDRDLADMGIHRSNLQELAGRAAGTL